MSQDFKLLSNDDYWTDTTTNMSSSSTPKKKGKRKLEQVEEKAAYPPLPKKIKDRIEGQKYMYKKQVRLWTGERLNCQHGRQPDVCSLCAKPKHVCEPCGVKCMLGTDWKKHLKTSSHLMKVRADWIIQGLDPDEEEEKDKKRKEEERKEKEKKIEEEKAKAVSLGYPLLPPLHADRVVGNKYVVDGVVRIWNGYRLNCEHNLDQYRCQTCALSPYKCEKCGYFFPSNSTYQLHLKSDGHNLSQEEKKEKLSALGKNALTVGDSVEKYIDSVLRTNPEIETVERMGNTGNTFDTIFKFRHETILRGIQTKAMTRDAHITGYYAIHVDSKYEDDTILTGANLEDSVYFVVPYSLVKKLTKICFTPEGKWASYLYKDEKKFTEVLFEQIKSTTVIKDNDPSHYLSREFKIEHDSLERLRKKCESLGLKYERNSTNTNPVDAFINSRTVQCKSTAYKSGKFVFLCFGKSGGNKKPKVSYTDKDGVDFFIFNLLTPELENNFYIIPTSVLVERGHVSREISTDNTKFTLPPPDHAKEHWTLRLSRQFLSHHGREISPLLGRSPFEKECMKRGLEYKKVTKETGAASVYSVSAKNVCFLNTKRKANKEHFYCVSIGQINKEKDGRMPSEAALFIVRIEELPGNYCIIPRSELFTRGYIKS